MKSKYVVLCCLASLLILCSADSDVAVTQTGNPTKVCLIIKADTSVAQPSAIAKRTVSGLNIEKAYMVIHRVQLDPVKGKEAILFKGRAPYVVRLMPDDGVGLTDSMSVGGANTYESFEMEIGPSANAGWVAPLPDSLLISHSILVRGYVGGSPQDTFTFTSTVDGDFEYEFDPAVELPNPAGTYIVVKIRVFEWFVDSGGRLLDPRVSGNKERIEENILNSVSGLEQ